MKKSLTVPVILAIVLAVVTVLLAQSNLAQAAAPTEGVSAQGCVIDLKGGTHNCQGVPGIQVLNITQVAAPAGQINGACNQSLLTLNVPLNHKATLQFYYAHSASGWTAHIGDSATNDGYGGDSGVQSNDAEAHIQDQRFELYASDYGNSQQLAAIDNLGLNMGKTATFVVSNNKLDSGENAL